MVGDEEELWKMTAPARTSFIMLCLMQKLLKMEKEIVREVALGGKTPPENICRSKSTNQFGERNERLPDLCFSICRCSQVVFIPRAQPHAQSLFLFPIVFGINLIHFFNEKKDGATGNLIV